MKELTMVRHAKSSWDDPGLADFDRPLNKRGKRDAPVMGKRLARRGVRPAQLMTSPAKRALATARLIAKELGFSERDLSINRNIYEAGASSLLGIIRSLDNGLDHVMVVGHNPGMTDICNLLAGANIDNVPTCGIVRIRLNVSSWADVASASGDLIEFDYPKKSKQGV